MPKLIVHAGFHKTGTTSVQKMLRKNRKTLRPYANIILRPGMLPLCEAARAWSINRQEWDLGLFKYEAAMLAEKFDPNETIILSSEDLSGHMPGRQGLRRYDATPRLMSAIDLAFREAQPKADISYLFFTRAAEPWLASCHVQHVKAARMTLSRKDYLRKFRKSADLDAVIDQVAEQLDPSRVHRHALEACAGQLGPLAPVLKLADVPDTIHAKLKIVSPADTAPPQSTIQRLLDLNRSNMSDEEVKDAKPAILKATDL
ncbi:MAG: hypothetical protein ABJL99_13115 [Aliishimia sp.]